jgi:deoxyribonuclease-2
MDANNKSLTPSTVPLSEQNQAVAYTLQQYYSVMNDPTVFHIMYNDEEVPPPPMKDGETIDNDAIRSGPRVEYGHTKGVAFFNRQTGIWLVHSVPLFPPTNSYSYPASGTIYGQSMLCISFNYNQLAKIGTQLFYNHPDIYSSALPTNMAADNPDLTQLIAGHYKTGAPAYSIVDLVSAGGNHFQSFAKTAEFRQDLYDGIVAPTLQTPLNVETWRRGSPVPLNCATAYRVLDVQDMKVGRSAEFKYTKDHSKLAISTSGLKPSVCIGDINRMTSQFVRGGGTVCISDTAVWAAYRVLVMDTNSC